MKIFSAQRHLSDVVVESEAPFSIEYRDSELEKVLRLTPPDLRFIDGILAAIENSDETTWEGSDAWIRAQFRQYLVGLLTCSMTCDSKQKEDYGKLFVDLLTKTRSHKVIRC